MAKLSEVWFRQRKWDPSIEEEFFRRLAKARPWKKPQFVRIQAYHLMESPEKYWETAEKLLDYFLESFPDDLQLAMALEQKGECREHAGDWAGALAAYKNSVERMREKPNVRCSAGISAARLTALLRLRSDYDFALQEIDRLLSNLALPMAKLEYVGEGSRALILDDTGNKETALTCARSALDAADRAHSGIRNHPKIGLVENLDLALQKRLEELVAPPSRKTSSLFH